MGETMKDNVIKTVNNEKGAAVVIALMVMMALAMIGGTALLTSTIEVGIARNERVAKEAFYIADAGTAVSSRVIDDVISTKEHPSYDSDYITIDDATAPSYDANARVKDEILGYNSSEAQCPDIGMSATQFENLYGEPVPRSLEVDLDRIDAEIMAGGAAEFAAGYEGVGAGAASGGIRIIYHIRARGNAPSGASILIKSLYRKVVNIGG
jgi:hypothetical protein